MEKVKVPPFLKPLVIYPVLESVATLKYFHRRSDDSYLLNNKIKTQREQL